MIQKKGYEVGALDKILDKQKLILAGEEVKAANGEEVAVLSRHQVVRCLASPDQTLRGDKSRQTVLEGVSFLAGIQVSADRRYVRVKLTEKAVAVEAIDKVKGWDGRDRKMEAETPVLKESTQSQVRWIPDFDSMLVPVQYRPRAVQAKERWWVLSITPRIYILEEEQEYKYGTPDAILPALIADVLNNPRLKATRAFYGTPDDKRFALVNSDAWTWPVTCRPDVPGYQMVPAERKGNRLLGIRIDHYPDARKENDNPSITVTLVNAGGSANGAVIGGGTIRYTTKSAAKGSVVELAEPVQP